MHIGFTGTREVPTGEQIEFLARVMLKLRQSNPGEVFFHHGDCMGADRLAHALARKFEFFVIIHPPDNRRYRAFCEDYFSIREEKQYVQRNRDIVLESDLLLGVPNTDREIVQSGTWATIRTSKKLAVPRIILFPDGSVSNQAPKLLKSMGIEL